MITKRQAIRECKKAWRLVLTGKAKDKGDILDTPEFQHFLNYAASCPLCEYTSGRKRADGEEKDCEKSCPLYTQLGHGCVYPSAAGYYLHPLAFAKEVMKLKD